MTLYRQPVSRVVPLLVLTMVLFVFWVTGPAVAQIWLGSTSFDLRRPLPETTPSDYVRFAEPQPTSLDRDRRRLYVTLKGEDAIGVYRFRRHALLAQWPVVGAPFDLIVGDTHVFVLTEATRVVSVLDKRTGLVTAQIPLPGAADRFVGAKNSNRRGVVTGNYRYLSLFQTDSLDFGPAFELPAGTDMVKLSDDGSVAIAAQTGGPIISLLTLENGGTETLKPCDQIVGMALGPGQQLAFACADLDQILLFEDFTSPAPTGVLALGEDAANDSTPINLSFDPDGRFLYTSRVGGEILSAYDIKGARKVHDMPVGTGPKAALYQSDMVIVVNADTGLLTKQPVPEALPGHAS